MPEADVTEPADFIGTVVAEKYVLNGVLGVGGMGAVYEATHAELGKRVAVKVISSDFAQSAEVERRFQREARAASAVESEHIVQVFDAGRDPVMGLYMVMEFLVGEDLSERLLKTGCLPLEEAVDLACQSLRGLLKAHAAGVVHRDLKPANLFLIQREDGSLLVKLLDFGVSKVLSDAKFASMPPQAAALTRTGSAIGTPQYMSPEQAQGLSTVDHRTDIWSLGAVLHEALTGTPPHEEMPTYEQTIIRIVTQPPRLLREIAPSVPLPLATVVDQMLAHDPDQRVALGAAMRAMLDVQASLGFRARQAYASLPDGLPLADVSSEWRSSTATPLGGSPMEARPPTSAAVVLEAERADQPSIGYDSAPPRPSDLPGVAASRRAFFATLVALAVILSGAAGAWYVTRSPADATGMVSPAITPPRLSSTMVASSETPGTVPESAGSNAPALIVVESADAADVAAPASTSAVPSTPPTRGSSKDSKKASSSSQESDKASKDGKGTAIEATEEKPPPPAPTQYGGVGVSESY